MGIDSSILISLVLIVLMAFVFGQPVEHEIVRTHLEPKGVIRTGRKYYVGCETFKSQDQIQIYRPTGLSVTQNSENLLGFGIKVFIIPKKSISTQYSTYWLNTTEVDQVSNNFTLYEPTAVIREGDKFEYSIQKQYKNGSTHWYECRAFYVNESSIKEVPQGQIGSYNSRSDGEKNNESQTTAPNQTNIYNTTEITKTFVLAENTDVTTESALREFIINRLTALLPSVDWNNTVTEVFRWNSKFSFDVKTAEEKRKILRLLEKNKKAAEVVLDFDNLEITDNDEDYDSATDTSG